MIRSEHMKSCLAAQILFMLFKGLGSFKKDFKISGNVNELKAYRLIPLTSHLFFHFTLPLRCQKNAGNKAYTMQVIKMSKYSMHTSRLITQLYTVVVTQKQRL
jgi:hypothetical protein